jgi:hypothetical protein
MSNLKTSKWEGFVRYDVISIVPSSVYTWAEGNLLINNISNLLKLEPSAFSHARTDHNEVTFKVEPNHKGWNSTQVAQQIG